MPGSDPDEFTEYLSRSIAIPRELFEILLENRLSRTEVTIMLLVTQEDLVPVDWDGWSRETGMSRSKLQNTVFGLCGKNILHYKGSHIEYLPGRESWVLHP